ncbi:147L [Invertebrate iridescent virus Kaz2018]|uniref:147L n=1 Tax=Invertebrate iridescent virus 6 TaxID=176652 RepID=Q91G02_IIV6|nr:147L [Invertebrate iridescent virus 6]AAK82030.1 147L [Invertebrate iridescent virus 6]QNH08557.1 147L [Invertebrate iridescent virus Kaz2018]
MVPKFCSSSIKISINSFNEIDGLVVISFKTSSVFTIFGSMVVKKGVCLERTTFVGLSLISKFFNLP